MNECDQIHDRLRLVRDFINTPRSQHAIMQVIRDWHQLCSALDLVGDTTIAMSSYLRTDYPDDDGEKYLLLYGLLQALFLQQDGITHIAEALGMPMELPNDMCEVRAIRNDAVGHPSKRGFNRAQTFHFVARHSISKSGFQIMSTTADGHDHVFRHVNVIGLANKQAREVVQYLESVLAEIEKREQEHRSRFREMKLVDLFPRTMSYYFSKVLEGIEPAGHGYRECGKAHLDMIVEKYREFKAELERREELPANDWMAYSLEQIMYPLESLTEYFENPHASRLNKRDARIFALFAKDLHDEMVEIAKEIDNQYDDGNEPLPTYPEERADVPSGSAEA